MSVQIDHPGVILAKMLKKKEISQRDLASKIDVTHALLNKILKGDRNITVNIALSLEAANFGKAGDWLNKQIKYSIKETKKTKKFQRKEQLIKAWGEIDNLIPISFFKRQDYPTIKSSEDVDKIYKIFEVKNLPELREKAKKFDPIYFRKSFKFKEEPNNIFAWSALAEYKAKKESVLVFNPLNEEDLIIELKKVLYKNNNTTISKTKSILERYGIKFLILDRPPKTPVEGKSFLSGNNPAIVLTLRYKRFDNFVYNLFHELGHVYRHLTNPKYKNANFYTNNSRTSIEELEADEYAKNNLIDPADWNEFVYLNEEDFNDDVIYNFSKKIKIHPAIIRGRVCYENEEYYRKRSSIIGINTLFRE